MPTFPCALCGSLVLPEVLDHVDRPDGTATPICLGCLATADDTQADGGPLPWELTCEVSDLALANDAYDPGEAA